MSPLEYVLGCDKAALIWVNSHHNFFLDAVLVPVSYAGEVGALWILVCLGLLIFGPRKHKKTAALYLLVLIVVDRVLAAGLGAAFPRERPYVAIDGIRQLGIRWTSGSFPSGHAHSVWLAAIIFGSRWHKLIIPLVIFSLLTCYSRPYLGMHYPVDVVAGSILGIAAGFATLGIEKMRRDRRTKPSQPPPQPAAGNSTS